MGAVELNSFVWASAGIEPQNPEDAIYIAGDQPIAGYDNYAMHSVTTDIENINNWAENHVAEHEHGGSQQLNIAGLRVGGTAAFVDDGTNSELHIVDSADHDTPLVRIDLDDDRIRRIPEFGTEPVFREGITLRSDIENASGDVVYDHVENSFHYADAAGHADTADTATDSDRLEGAPRAAFIEPDDADVAPTGKWEFDQPVGADINGHATSSTYSTYADEAEDSDQLQGRTLEQIAEIDVDEVVSGSWSFNQHITGSIDEAGWADEADHADTADLAADATLLDSWTRQEIIDAASGDASHETTVEDSGTHQLSALEPTFNFDTHLSVTQNGDTVDVDVGKVDEAGHADSADEAARADWASEAEYSQDSNRVDGYHAQEVIDLARAGMDNGRWELLDVQGFAMGSDWEWHFDAEPGKYNQYRVTVVNEPGGTSNNEMWMRVNQEGRKRYYWFQHNCSHGNIFWEDRRGTSFPIALTRYGYVAVSEYIVTLPPTVDSSATYPTISAQDHVGHARAYGGTTHWGHVETNFETLTHFKVEPATTSAGYIAIWGGNLPTV